MKSVLERVRNWVASERERAQLRRMDPLELQRVAADACVSVNELGALAACGKDSAALLPRRMRELGIDPAVEVRKEPAVMRDLQRLCSQCGHHERCEQDLDTNPKDAGWQTYCPNVATLRSLQ